MAVTYRELLGTRYFRKFRVEAGTKGLEKKIGLVLTCEEALSDKNSYVFLCKMSYHQKEISLDFVREIIERGYSGLGVQKEDGEPFDPEIRKFCEENNFPLIRIPKQAHYMDIVRNVDSLCVDRKVQNIYDIINIQTSNDHDAKLAKTIHSLSVDLERDVKIYDFFSRKIFLPDGRILRNVETSQYESVWNPAGDFQKKDLAERIPMYLLSCDNEEETRRIILPIHLRGETLGYLTIEAGGLEKDYNSLYSIKITYLFVVSEYKLVYQEVEKENETRDEILRDIAKGILNIDDVYFMKYFGKDKMRPFTIVAIRQFTEDLNMFMRRERIEKCIYHHLNRKDVFLGILDLNELVLLVAQDRQNRELQLKTLLGRIAEDLKMDMPRARFAFGVSETYTGIEKLGAVYEESLGCLERGIMLAPEQEIFSEEDLGPFQLFDLRRMKERGPKMYAEFAEPFLREKDGKELLLTLREYLRCGSSVSATAKKMYLHNNTIRYRIEKIEEILGVSLKDPFTRLKAEILLEIFCDKNA